MDGVKRLHVKNPFMKLRTIKKIKDYVSNLIDKPIKTDLDNRLLSGLFSKGTFKGD